MDRNIELIKAVMEKKGKRTVDNFSVGDIIRINIPKVDRVKFFTLYITDGGIGCSSGRINGVRIITPTIISLTCLPALFRNYPFLVVLSVK